MSFKTRLLSSDPALFSTGFSLAHFNRYNASQYPALLASSIQSQNTQSQNAQPQNNAQFDILFACPQYKLTLENDKTLSLTGSDGNSDNLLTNLPIEAGFLACLEALYQKEAIGCHTDTNASEASSIPFTGGWFVYLGYELAAEIEPCLSLPAVEKGQAIAVALRCPAALIYDKQARQLIAVAEADQADLLDCIADDFAKLTSVDTEESSAGIALATLDETQIAPYLEQVNKIKQYIVDGDIFQANLSRRWTALLAQDVDDARLFSALARQNPSSFAALVSFDHFSVISSSPERLVSLVDGVVETRPIAGTRPRDEDQEHDKALADELLSNQKEQAEHIMLIDLERNDLGRVCVPGSIEVNELMVLESWQHVHHIVSNVKGELQADKSPIDVIRAVFPGGTITGCPKVRCMEILAELEQEPRGAYTGSLGYINRSGKMDLNILIRTMVRKGNRITFRAGGGIVSDSIAERELEETRAKAKGLLRIFEPLDVDAKAEVASTVTAPKERW